MYWSLQDEVRQDYLQEIANRDGYVMAACNWWGMSRDDVVALVATFATHLSNIDILPDRLTQGMTNALLLMKLMRVRSYSIYCMIVLSTFIPQWMHWSSLCSSERVVTRREVRNVLVCTPQHACKVLVCFSFGCLLSWPLSLSGLSTFLREQEKVSLFEPN